MFARSNRRVPTIRVLAHASLIGSGLVALLVTVGLISTSARLESSTDTMFSSAQSFALAREAQLALLTYQRISNLYTVTGDPELEDARNEMLAQLRGILASAEDYVSSSAEAEQLDELSALLDQYLQERSGLEAQQVEIEVMLAQTQASINRVVGALELLHDLNQQQALRARSDAMRWNRRVSAFSGAAAFLLVCGLLAIAVGMHHAVLKPLLDLHETIERFSSGAIETRAQANGLREVRELAQRFNEMANALAKQREDQLAFLAGVAHDLRNPLHALRLGIHSLAFEPSRAERGLTHDALDRQLDRLTRMVEDLLDATRIEAGKLEMRFEEFDLRVAVDDMIRLYAPTSAHHRISAKLPRHPVVIEGDRLRLEQVVSNLLSNAIKYSPDGGTIRVAVEQEADAVVLSVADEGIGIRPEDRSEIFLPFRPRKSDAPAGAGLGLSVVRRIIDAHGGRIDVESGDAQGTLFRVILQRRIAPPDPHPFDGANVGAA